MQQDGTSTLVIHGDRSNKRIALTYDAGGDATSASAIVDALTKYGIRSTFFLTGQWVESHVDIAARIMTLGHEVANHSYSHPDLTTLSYQEVVDEVRKGADTLHAVLGVETRPLFRHPFGAWNQTVLQAVGSAGFPYSVYWSLDTIDWDDKSASMIEQRILSRVRNGDIILMHLGGLHTARGTEQVIPKLKRRGFQMVTVGEMLKRGCIGTA